MQTIIEFFANNGYIPHGYCLSWSPVLVWLHVISDLTITISYYSIPVCLAYFVRNRKDLPFPYLFGLFGLFILACGTTHLLSAVLIWIPVYWLDGFVKAFTALISFVSAIAMFWIIPKALQLPSPTQLQAEIEERKKAEQALLVNKAQYRSLLENLPDVIVRYNRDLIRIYVNKAWEKYHGIPAADVLNKPFHDYPGIMSGIADDYEAKIQSVFANGQAIELEHSWTNENNDFFALELRIIPELDQYGQIISVLGMSKNITERKRAQIPIEHANFMTETALKLFKSAYWQDPLDGSGEYISSAAKAAMLGDPPRPNHRYHIEKEWLDNIRAADPAIAEIVIADYINQLTSGQTELFITYPYKRPADGNIIWVQTIGRTVKNNAGEVTSIIGASRDVTEAKLQELALLEAKQAAENATQAKSSFLANMSHEIRTPMNAIIGMTYLVLQTKLDNQQLNYISKVDAAAKNLLGIINDILDFSKIEAGKLEFEHISFHLEDIMQQLSDLSVVKAQEKGLELLFDVGTDVPTGLIGDPLRLSQVLTNLINNAIKFTEQGEVLLRIRKLDEDTESVRLGFEVIDSGIGMTEAQRGKLFTAFSQADCSTTRKYGGTGLGLTISKNLVELMDGEINVTSNSHNSGSTFHFTAKFGRLLEPEQTTIAPEDIRGLRILIVDDNASAREILLNMLSALNFKAVAVASGHGALTALKEAQTAQSPFGLVLLDWLMPGMDGLETIKRIQEQGILSHIPAIIMVSAYSRDELLQQTRHTNVQSLLTKPVTPSSVLDAILNAFNRKTQQRPRKQQWQQDLQLSKDALAGAYLLLVEDNPVNQELAMEILGNAGIRLDVASNGLEALDKVSQNHYDGVLMDCQMPLMDGFEATRKIRQELQYPDLPIIAMTANAMEGDKLKCYASGMNDHITKPLDVAQLFATVNRWVKPNSPPVGTSPAAPISPTILNTELAAKLGLQTDEALQRLGGNMKLLEKLLRSFAENQSAADVRLKSDIEHDDTEAAIREAHTLKGLAGNIGATKIAGQAQKIESLLSQNTTDELPEAIASLELELAAVIKRINDVLPPLEAKPAEPGTVDMEIIAGNLKQLYSLLADDNADANKVVDDVCVALTHLNHKPAAQRIKKFIAQYDYKEAMAILEEIAPSLGVNFE